MAISANTGATIRNTCIAAPVPSSLSVPLRVLEHVAPVGMLVPLGVHIGAQRDDLDALGAGILDQPRCERAGYTHAAEGVGHERMVGDDQVRIDPAVGEFALAIDAGHLGHVAALGWIVLARD